MNAVVPFAPNSLGAVSSRFAGVPVENDMAAGIQRGFGMIGYKGKVWSIKWRGTEQKLMRDDGDGPRGSIEIVVLKSAGHLSKVWYEKGFVEGTSEAPDCFSTNGVTPDPASKKKQANVCATCPKNAFGSAVKQDGTSGKGKACSDSKRLAVVPLNDLRNEVYGGPMLLRTPAGSLGEMATFTDKMAKLGYVYYSYAMRVSFDPQAAHPAFVFSAIRTLTDAEADIVLSMRDDETVTRILAEGDEGGAAPVAALPAPSPFEQPPQPVAVAVTPVSNVVPLVVPVATPAPQPATIAPPAPAPVPTAAAPAPQPIVSSGFGPVASVAATSTPAPTAPVAVAQPAPAASSSEASAPEDFEAELNRQLNALLPPAQ